MRRSVVMGRSLAFFGSWGTQIYSFAQHDLIGRALLKPPPWRGEHRRRQGLVDPGRRRQRRGDWHPTREALGMRLVGGAQDLGAPLPLARGQTVVDVLGGHQAEGAVPVLGVVPGEEALAERLGVL